MTPQIGNLYTHFLIDGLFIITYKSETRVGLRSLNTGKMRYINEVNFDSQYTEVGICK